MKLHGKNAIITGTNRGIGLAALKLFAREGCNIWACARKQNDEFEKTIQELSGRYGVEIKPVYFELTDYETVKVAVKEITSEKKPIDILVNSAGISASGSLIMTSLDKVKEVFEVNYFAQINLIQLVSKVMIRQKGGSIVNVASVRGINPIAGAMSYASSKAALICTTKVISKDLSPFGIRVNAVAPSLTDTDMGNNRKPEELERLVAHTALKRMATPKEIASCILFLASDDSSFVTGEVLTVDGGQI
jgi:3-oxoacyl-[acyl-carrier protein] reductase